MRPSTRGNSIAPTKVSGESAARPMATDTATSARQPRRFIRLSGLRSGRDEPLAVTDRVLGAEQLIDERLSHDADVGGSRDVDLCVRATSYDIPILQRQ